MINNLNEFLKKFKWIIIILLLLGIYINTSKTYSKINDIWNWQADIATDVNKIKDYSSYNEDYLMDISDQLDQIEANTEEY